MTHRNSSSPSRRMGGFTLVELMITCVILAIIVGVALPAFTSQMHKARRADARNALLDMAGREERFLSVSNSYSQVTTDLGYSGVWPQTVSNGFYQISATVPDPAFLGNGPSFILTATNFGPQLSDTDCATFTVNQLGQQKAFNSANVDNSATCWGL